VTFRIIIESLFKGGQAGGQVYVFLLVHAWLMFLLKVWKHV